MSARGRVRHETHLATARVRADPAVVRVCAGAVVGDCGGCDVRGRDLLQATQQIDGAPRTPDHLNWMPAARARQRLRAVLRSDAVRWILVVLGVTTGFRAAMVGTDGQFAILTIFGLAVGWWGACKLGQSRRLLLGVSAALCTASVLTVVTWVADAAYRQPGKPSCRNIEASASPTICSRTYGDQAWVGGIGGLSVLAVFGGGFLLRPRDSGEATLAGER